ncbi:MAG: Mrp/NBP35 family ATP-binding protein [Candidatus Brocadiaceae bacterium]|jgi:Mrp family chromosome partitioning ATPase
MKGSRPGEAGTDQARREQMERQNRKLQERMSGIRHVVVVLSGKGGVGKSTVAANLAVALTGAGLRVGLLDADMHGPSVPRLLGLSAAQVLSDGEDILPAVYGPHMKVMSITFLVRAPEEAVIWRGPLKMNVLRQLLADVDWGELDFLVVDLPPGTGDEPLSICQLIPDATGAIVVTTPQELAVSDVRKCITFCRRLELPVLGVLENMSGFVCPHCGKTANIFGDGGGQKLAVSMNVPFLGAVPIDPEVVRCSDEGEPFVEHRPDSPATRAFQSAMKPIIELGAEAPGEEN